MGCIVREGIRFYEQQVITNMVISLWVKQSVGNFVSKQASNWWLFKNTSIPRSGLYQVQKLYSTNVAGKCYI
jgi:hypothetical protein